MSDRVQVGALCRLVLVRWHPTGCFTQVSDSKDGVLYSLNDRGLYTLPIGSCTVIPVGLEPTTYSSANCRSIQLSYGIRRALISRSPRRFLPLLVLTGKCRFQTACWLGYGDEIAGHPRCHQ